MRLLPWALLDYTYAMVPLGTALFVCNDGSCPYLQTPLARASLATFQAISSGGTFFWPAGAVTRLTFAVSLDGTTTVPWRDQGFSNSGLTTTEWTAGLGARPGDRGKPAC
jgi:hypothetical protein